MSTVMVAEVAVLSALSETRPPPDLLGPFLVPHIMTVALC